MRWYEGGIADAVALTKQKSAIFVVFIEGKDDQSKQLAELLDHQNVSSKLESELFVPIKIEANSMPHQQFTQIYKQATVPSIFFIGKTGAPIGVIVDAPNADEFIKKINSFIEIHTGKSVTQSESFIKNEQGSTSSNVVCENGVCRRVPSEAATSASELSAEEKMEKAKELIEKKREQKLLEEKEKERVSELERRKVGQDVQKLKRWQEDQKLKDVLDERQRERQQEKAARDRVLAQIAQDKADRAARFSNNTPPQVQNSAQVPLQRASSTNSNIARLQFKLPDGSSHTHDFASSEPLEVVRAYISTNLNLSITNYVLSTAFPRREFTDSNNAESLADLGLAPNAVILVLPGNRGTVSTRSTGFVTGLFWALLAPFFNLFDYLRTFVFGGGTTRGSSTNQDGARTSSPDAGASTSRLQSKRSMGGTTVIKRQGNIHRLSDRTDSDDDNNTWNGNSTQQM